MKDISSWLVRYSQSHQNSMNIKIHYICVPLIIFSLFGLLWEIEIPALRSKIDAFNAALIFVAGVGLFYLLLSLRLLVVMAAFFTPFLLLNYVLHKTDAINLWVFYGLIFTLAWAAQFIGHKIEGKKPSFFEDLLFLFIGPVWLIMKIGWIKKVVKG